MIVKSLVKNKKHKLYDIKIDDKDYTFCEDTILEYRLVPNKELDEETLNKAINSNSILIYYDMAMNYSIKYAKGRKATYDYLIRKGVSKEASNEIITRLVNKEIINDLDLIDSLIASLIKSGNGIILIKHKLIEKGFKTSDIEVKLQDIDYELYYEALEKLYNKIKNKYDKFENYIRINKIKMYLLNRGYTYDDISSLDIK